MIKFDSEDNVNAIATQAAGVALDDIEGRNHSFSGIPKNDHQDFPSGHGAGGQTGRFPRFTRQKTSFNISQEQDPDRVPLPADGHPIRVSLGRPEEMIAFWRTWDLLPFAKDFLHH